MPARQELLRTFATHFEAIFEIPDGERSAQSLDTSKTPYL